MTEKERAAAAAPMNPDAKVMNPTDLAKVLDFFRYTEGTSLDCAVSTGILRNCITWYVRDLEEMNLLQAIYVASDKRTKFKAKYYSADPKKWRKSPENKQLSLFQEGGNYAV